MSVLMFIEIINFIIYWIIQTSVLIFLWVNARHYIAARGNVWFLWLCFYTRMPIVWTFLRYYRKYVRYKKRKKEWKEYFIFVFSTLTELFETTPRYTWVNVIIHIFFLSESSEYEKKIQKKRWKREGFQYRLKKRKLFNRYRIYIKQLPQDIYEIIDLLEWIIIEGIIGSRMIPINRRYYFIMRNFLIIVTLYILTVLFMHPFWLYEHILFNYQFYRKRYRKIRIKIIFNKRYNYFRDHLWSFLGYRWYLHDKYTTYNLSTNGAVPLTFKGFKYVLSHIYHELLAKGFKYAFRHVKAQVKKEISDIDVFLLISIVRIELFWKKNYETITRVSNGLFINLIIFLLAVSYINPFYSDTIYKIIYLIFNAPKFYGFATFIFPLIGFLYLGLFGRFLGRYGSPFIAIFSVFLAWVSTLIWISQGFFYINFNVIWFHIGSFKVFWSFNFGSLSWIMAFLVTTVALVVHIFSFFYMYTDQSITRFFSYLNLFTFFMLFLIVSDNLLLMFWGWEGVGICSYLLINFWYTRLPANKSALKAVFINKISDIFFFYAILLIIIEVNTVELPIIFTLIPFYTNSIITICGFDFFFINVVALFTALGSFGKSAQIGLHLWLPDAMEGPTPVSALIHAATMVTAGIFLIIRLSLIFEYCPDILKLILFVGCFTAFVSSVIGSFQYDIKKIIAYSTCSQLGYMFVACGLSQYSLSLFHLFTHAFFKSLLFLSSGLIIHIVNSQDVRDFEKKKKLHVLVKIFFLIPSLSLCGLPFLSGSCSKEIIISLSATNYILDGDFIFFSLLITAAITSFYSIKLLYFIYSKKNLYVNIFSIKDHQQKISFWDGRYKKWLKDEKCPIDVDIEQWIHKLEFTLNKYLKYILPKRTLKKLYLWLLGETRVIAILYFIHILFNTGVVMNFYLCNAGKLYLKNGNIFKLRIIQLIIILIAVAVHILRLFSFFWKTYWKKEKVVWYRIITSILFYSPLILLADLSISSGFFFQDIFIGFSSNYFDIDINFNPINKLKSLDYSFNFFFFFKKYLPLLISLLFFFFFELLNFIFKSNIKTYYFFKLKLYFDFIYNYAMLYFNIKSFEIFFKYLDKGALELFGSNGVTRHSFWMIKHLSFFNISFSFNYICLFLFFFTFSLFF